MSRLIGNTDFLGLPLFKKGKVRDVYFCEENLLIISTDRISAFDVVFSDLIPEKGKILNSISEFWFNYTKHIIKNHMIATNVEEFPRELSLFKEELQGRSMLVKKAEIIPVECIVRGYLEGSGLKEYQKTGSVCGVKLPQGIRQCEKLGEPIFTPTTKEEEGHDKSITFSELVNIVGKELAVELKDIAIKLFLEAGEYVKKRGLILADTKLEFGFIDGELVIADEIFTPDSSRYWPMADYEPGRPQKSFDKQYLREYLEKTDWNKEPPAPSLPDYVVKNTSHRYIEAYEKITGNSL